MVRERGEVRQEDRERGEVRKEGGERKEGRGRLDV